MPLRGLCRRRLAERPERALHRRPIPLLAQRLNALDLRLFQRRVIGSRNRLLVCRVGEAIHTHDHGLSSLDAQLVLVCAARDLLLKESGGDRLLRAAELIDFFRSKSDRKSTRLNSSHRCISYAVFCLKKKITFAYY